MLTVLVTGAAGYIGSTLCPMLLERGYRVIAIDNFYYGNYHGILPCLGRAGYDFHEMDVTGKYTTSLVELYKQADIIIPLAALVGAPVCDLYPQSATNVNCDAIIHLMAHVASWQHVIYPNTNSGYGETDGIKAVSELDPLKPISIYGKTKCLAEEVVLQHHNGKAFRLATVFGCSPRPRFDLMVNDFTQKLMEILGDSNAEPFQIFEPHFKRNFVHVRDVARAFIFAIDHRYSMQGVYNLGNPDANMTKMELAHRICSVIGLSTDMIQVGKGEDKDKRNYLVSNDKLLNTGFKFEHSLDDGIREIALLSSLYTSEQIASMKNV